MPEWTSSSGAFVIYGALLAIGGGVLGGWLERRWTRSDNRAQYKKQVLLEMLDILATTKSEFIDRRDLRWNAPSDPAERQQLASQILSQLRRLLDRSQLLNEPDVRDATQGLWNTFEDYLGMQGDPIKENQGRQLVLSALTRATDTYCAASDRLGK